MGRCASCTCHSAGDAGRSSQDRGSQESRPTEVRGGGETRQHSRKENLTGLRRRVFKTLLMGRNRQPQPCIARAAPERAILIGLEGASALFPSRAVPWARLRAFDSRCRQRSGPDLLLRTLPVILLPFLAIELWREVSRLSRSRESAHSAPGRDTSPWRRRRMRSGLCAPLRFRQRLGKTRWPSQRAHRPRCLDF